MDHDNGNKYGDGIAPARGEDTRGVAANSSLISLLSLPPSHPFHGTTTMEQRQRYWDSLPTYSGASTPVAGLGAVRAQVSAFSSFSTTPSFPSFPSFSTLRPASAGNQDADEACEDVVEQERRKAIYDEERPIIPSPTEAKGKRKEKDKGKGKKMILGSLCCRAQSGTPFGQSRLPVRVGAAIPMRKRYKVKKGLVRMSLESRDDLGGGPSTQMSLMPRMDRTPPPRPRRPDEEESLLPLHSHSSSSSSLPSSSTDPDSRDVMSVEERLRNTTLEDLPLSEQDAAEVRSLVAELVKDREGMSGTWPPRSRKGAGR